MLVLTRKPGEKIVIGGNIEVTVSAVGKERVKLAFQAPPEVTIHRQEVVERIVAENRFSRRERLVEACCH